MESYKCELIEMMVRAGVLTFGDFVTKSGRKTPYFINTGNFKTGAQLGKLGEFYARRIYDSLGVEFDALFGPAYKGIPLVSAAAMSLYRLYGVDKPYCFNRKEVKDHGEGGLMVGYKPKASDRIVIVEDVVTAGTAVRETVELFKKTADVFFSGLIVLADRRERGTGDMSALDELEMSYGLKVFPIVDIYEIVDYLFNREIDGNIYVNNEIKAKIEEYLRVYGASKLQG